MKFQKSTHSKDLRQENYHYNELAFLDESDSEEKMEVHSLEPKKASRDLNKKKKVKAASTVKTIQKHKKQIASKNRN